MALQLAKIVNSPTNANRNHRPRIEIQKDTLDKVLNACGERPLCIVSICGPARQGKSFLMNHMIRHLNATQKGNDDCMGSSTPYMGLQNAFTWGSGYDPVTRGIWIWEKPFIFPSSDGEYAVLLIDTEGTFDKHSSQQDTSAIFGFSLLISSVMIVNSFSNISEDIICSLGTFLEYGQLALLEDDFGEKPFQKLKFLVRDWNSPNDFQFGESGGTLFLRERLGRKGNHSENAKRVRKNIKDCFEEVSCYLMPAIGGRALANDYDGNINATKKKFAKKMDDFITSLVEEDLPVKKIVRREVKSKELRNYISSYVDALNNTTVTNALSLWEATSLCANSNTVDHVKKTYQDEMSRQKRGKLYFSTENFINASKASKEAALGFLAKTQMYRTHSDSFRKEIDDFFEKEENKNRLLSEQLHQQNLSNKRRAGEILQNHVERDTKSYPKRIQGIVKHAEKLSQDNMQELQPVLFCAIGEDIEILQGKSKILIDEILGSFDQSSFEETFAETYVERFQSKWQVIKQQTMKKWDNNFEGTIQKLVDIYRHKIQKFVDGHEMLGLASLEKEHLKLKASAVEALALTENGREMYETSKLVLQKIIDSHFNEFKILKNQRDDDCEVPNIGPRPTEAPLSPSILFQVSLYQVVPVPREIQTNLTDIPHNMTSAKPDSKLQSTSGKRRYSLNFGEHDILYAVLPKVRADLIPKMNSKQVNTQIILQLSALNYFDSEIEILINGENQTQQERMVALFDLMRNLNKSKVLACFELMCNLDNQPGTSETFREIFKKNFPECM